MALKEYIDENIAKNFIQHLKSPTRTSIFFIKKKDGALQMCMDYCDLYKLIVKNAYPLPLISCILDQLGHAIIYTKIDLQGAYNCVCVKKRNERKIAF